MSASSPSTSCRRSGTSAVKDLTWEQVNKFHGSMARIPRRANYVTSTLRALLNFAERVGIRPLHSNPVQGRRILPRECPRKISVAKPRSARPPKRIEQAEREGVIGPHAAAGLRLALFTGARSGEITAIQWSHIDWNRKQVRLPDCKTNTPRTIHLGDAAIEVLKTVPRVGPFVIAGAKPGEAYKNLTRAWITARDYAGLDDVRLHDLAAFLRIACRRSRRVVADDRKVARSQGCGDDDAICASGP